MAKETSIPKDKATAEAIIRALAKEYLEKPGINSIGFGYKETDGRGWPTTLIAVPGSQLMSFSNAS